MNEGRAARCYLRANRHGALATISLKMPGYPFGSIVPFTLDHRARPVILASRLAEHTKNIRADSRASLLVHESAADVQAASRLTVIGDAHPVDSGLDSLKTRYLSIFPDAKRLFDLGDFTLFQIEPVQLRFIGGFGSIHWISAASYAPPANCLASHEAEIIAHMNAEHPQVLRDCCRHLKGTHLDAPLMIGIDCDGFDVRADEERLRFEFPQPITDPPSARRALIEMAHEARHR